MRSTRAEVPLEQTWNLDDLFLSHASWAGELESIEQAVGSVTRYQGRLGDEAPTLAACLDAREALHGRLMRAGAYASLRNAADGTHPENQAATSRVAALDAKVQSGISFVDTEILRLPDGTIARFLAQEPLLGPHATNLHDLLEIKPHMLGAEAEKVLASLEEILDAPYMVYNRAKASDMQFAPFADSAGTQHANSFNLYEGVYESHPDPIVRRHAWRSFCDGLKPYRNTYAATFATEVSKNVVLARLRGYSSPEHFLLRPHKIPLDLYTNILQIIQAGLAPHMQRYARLRRRVLGLEKLLYCDIKAPIDPEYAPHISYAEASDLILESLAPMGEEYCALMRQTLTQRWVDRADNIGKSSGAFCASPYGVHPFILITWSDSMRNAFTLAHELGHAGHFGLAMRSQRLVNLRPAMTFVEAPSIMNEMLLARHILARSTDPRMRRWVIMQTLGTYHHNFVTHLLEAQLQHQVYGQAEAGQSITASALTQAKQEILAKFWGDAVEIDEDAGMTWMRQPHYYLGLYPYTYSVGLVASTALAGLFAQEGPPVLERWLQVLKAGGTMKPLELLKAAGIDLSSPEPIRKAVAHVGALVDELEQSFGP